MKNVHNSVHYFISGYVSMWEPENIRCFKNRMHVFIIFYTYLFCAIIRLWSKEMKKKVVLGYIGACPSLQETDK